MTESKTFTLTSKDLWKIGDDLVSKIEKEYALKGFFVSVSFGHNDGTDIEVHSIETGRLVKVIECKNYHQLDKRGKREYIAKETFLKDVERLNSYDVLPNVEKEFIVSYLSILSPEQKEVLRLHCIKIREIGYFVE
jgi:hypothetical protein